MNKSELHDIISKGEGINVEFKRAENALPKNLFETICAFLNHSGGSIVLGVDDNRQVVGVQTDKAEQFCKEISNLSNNSNKLNPTFLLQPEVVNYDDKKLIYLFVPASSQVHQTAGTIYDRSSDGDFVIKSQARISELYLNKSTFYSENTIYPYLKEAHFDQNTIQKAKNLIRNNRPDHPWLALSTEDFYRVSGLYRYDINTNTEGFTLAALLLFGKEEIIQSTLPYYRIDAILRKVDIERYDDRITVCCNLIEASEKLMNFIAKHLPDPFYLEGTHRISLRDNTFREIIANSLIHREYLNPKPSLLAIYADRVVTENANKPYLYGRIDPTHYTSFPKNPRLALFFVQMAMAEALGTGIRKITNYAKLYTGKEPIFADEDMFRITVLLPQTDETSQEGVREVTNIRRAAIATRRKNSKELFAILDLIQKDPTITTATLAERLSVSERTIRYDIQQLIKEQMLSKVERKVLWVIPEKANENCHNRQNCHERQDCHKWQDCHKRQDCAVANDHKISQTVLDLIQEDNTISIAALSKRLKIPTRTLRYHIQRLIKQGLLSRAEKQVLWEIIENTETQTP